MAPIPDALPLAEYLAQHETWLRDLARRILPPDLADDAVQETLLAALDSPPSDQRQLDGWLFTVLRNTGRRSVRERSRRTRRERKVARSEALRLDTPRVEVDEVRDAVRDAVLALDEPYRSVIVLHFLEGLSPREIARERGAPDNTVRVQINRALAILEGRLTAKYRGRERSLLGALFFCAEFGRPTSAVPRTESDRTDSPTSSDDHLAKGVDGPTGLSSIGWKRTLAAVCVLASVAWIAWSWPDGGERVAARSVTRQSRPTAPSSTVPRSSPTAPSVESSILPRPLVVVGQPTSPTNRSIEEFVTVVVRDSVTDEPIDAATVEFSPNDWSSRSTSGGRGAIAILRSPWTATARFSTGLDATEGGGTVTVPRSHLGDRLRVSAPGYVTHRERAHVRALDDDRYIVALRSAEPVTVTTVDADGVPRAGVSVTIEDSSGVRRTASTDDSGALRFDWEASDYFYRVTSPHFVATADLVRAPETRIVVEPGTPGRATVHGPDGRPVRGVVVRYRPPGWRDVPLEITTDDRGEFATAGLPTSGEVTLAFHHDVFVTASRKITLPWVDSIAIDLRWGATIRGSLTTPTGASAADSVVRLIPIGESFYARDLPEAIVDGEGHFQLGPVANGEYELVARHDHWGRIAESVVIENGADVTTTMTFRRPRTVRGRCVDREGAPVANVDVQLGEVCGDEIWGPRVCSDHAGRFEFVADPTELPPLRRTRRDLRWTAFPAESTHGLLFSVDTPFTMLARNHQPIPTYGLLGSRNTAAYDPSTTETVLRIQYDPPTREGSAVDLRGADDRRIRTVVNLVVVPRDVNQPPSIIFAGTNGQPRRLNDDSLLAGALLVYLTREYAPGIRLHDNLDREAITLGAKIPRTVRVAADDVAGHHLYVMPSHAGVPFPRGLYIGSLDDGGTLSLDDLPVGDYSGFLLAPDLALAAPRRWYDVESSSAGRPLPPFRVDATSRVVELTLNEEEKR